MEISEGQFRSSLKEVRNLLRDVELLKTSGTNPRTGVDGHSKFSMAFFEASQSKSYEEILQIAMENADFDYLLNDDSFFQYSMDVENNKVRYAFYDSFHPTGQSLLELYLHNNKFDNKEIEDIKSDENNIEMLRDLGVDMAKYLDQFEMELVPIDTPTPLRYDYDPELHGERTPTKKIKNPAGQNFHSSAHIHIGIKQSVRVPLQHELTPLEFTSFVLRMVYPQTFQNYVDKNAGHIITKKSKHVNLSSKEFTPEEKEYLYLV